MTPTDLCFNSSHINGSVAYDNYDGNATYGNSTVDCTGPFSKAPLDARTIVVVCMYGIICVVGLLGNGLVILVISRYTNMKTVTNLYILNLSMADFLFLLGLPLVMSTAILRQWVFGEVLCKIYFCLTMLNMFTGAFTLTLMSADRFLAVVHPISSLRWRTPRHALIALGALWLLSALVLLPVLLYARLEIIPGIGYGCDIVWPTGQAITGHHAFFTYTLLLGFVIPVTLIILLYSLLLVRLRNTGAKFRSADKRRSHRKVTRLVSLVIGVFIACWLPHWAIQTHLILHTRDDPTVMMPAWQLFLITLFTLLSYANSMVNPLLYAFTNESFRDAFISAFFCVADPILIGRRQNEYYHSTVANNNHHVGQAAEMKPLNPGQARENDEGVRHEKLTVQEDDDGDTQVIV